MRRRLSRRPAADAIVTVQSLDGEGVENYAWTSTNTWSRKQERQSRRVVACRLRTSANIASKWATAEPVINDARAEMRVARLVPFLRQGDYGNAAEAPRGS